MTKTKKNPSTQPENFLDYFRDPPDVRSLLDGKQGMLFCPLRLEDAIKAKTNSMNCSVDTHVAGHGGSTLVANVEGTSNTKGGENRSEGGNGTTLRFSLLRSRPDGRNQAHILSAVMFLIHEFQQVLLAPPDKRESVTPCRDGVFFRELATKLELEQPVLRGVTGPALWAMYDRTMKMYRDLCTSQPGETVETLAPTCLTKLTKELFGLNEKLLDFVSPKDKNKDWEKQDDKQERRAWSVESSTVTPVDQMAKKRKEEFDQRPTAVAQQQQFASLLEQVHEQTIIIKELAFAVKEQSRVIKEQSLVIKEQAVLLQASQQSVIS